MDRFVTPKCWRISARNNCIKEISISGARLTPIYFIVIASPLRSAFRHQPDLPAREFQDGAFLVGKHDRARTACHGPPILDCASAHVDKSKSDEGRFARMTAVTSPKNSFSPGRRLTPIMMRSCFPFFASVRIAFAVLARRTVCVLIFKL